MQVELTGCCRGNAVINGTISAEVFQDLDGNFMLATYTFSSGMTMSVSIMLLFGAAVLALLLPN